MTRLAVTELRSWVEQVMTAAGMPPADAQLAADSLVTAEMRGIPSHGVMRAMHYVNGILDGNINATPDIQEIAGKGAVRVLDGDNGLGVVVVQRATDLAVTLSEQFGVGSVAVRNSNHSGVLAVPALRGARRGAITQVYSGAPPLMAPWGGRESVISNAPMAIAIPTGDFPIVLDLACSVAARGRVRLAAKLGEDIPEGWALDSSGQPTTDAAAAMEGSVLPFGQHKGSGLAIVNEIYSWALSAATPCYLVPTAFLADGVTTLDSWGVGHFVTATDPGAFFEPDAFAARIDAFIRVLRSVEPADSGRAVLVPGDLEHESELRSLSDGLEIDDGSLEGLRELSHRLQVSTPSHEQVDHA